MVPGTGLEPVIPFEKGILSPLRIPFRHPGRRRAASRTAAGHANRKMSGTKRGRSRLNGHEEAQEVTEIGKACCWDSLCDFSCLFVAIPLRAGPAVPVLLQKDQVMWLSLSSVPFVSIRALLASRGVDPPACRAKAPRASAGDPKRGIICLSPAAQVLKLCPFDSCRAAAGPPLPNADSIPETMARPTRRRLSPGGLRASNRFRYQSGRIGTTRINARKL